MNKKKEFEQLRKRIESLIKEKKDLNQILLNISSLLNEKVPYYNWVGFYILDLQTNTLKLGPYVGAGTDHTEIEIGKGICGQVAEKKKTMIIQDVSKENNYLSCSIHVKSEIVVPILKNKQFVAELDIDSHELAPFDKEDQSLLELICQSLTNLF